MAIAALRSVGELHGEALILTDANGRIVAINRVAESLIGWRASDLVGQRCRRFLRCLDGNALGRHRASCCNTGSGISGEIVRRMVRTDGGGRLPVVARNSNILNEDNGLPGTLCCFTPEPRGGLLDRASAELLSNVSHDLRTPLSSLAISIDLLSSTYESMSPQDLGHVLQVFHNSTLQLRNLVENLLSASSIQLGCFHIQPKPSDLGEIVEESVNLVQPILGKKRQRLQKCIPDELPAVKVDSRRIQQVVINLLSNASKYSPFGNEVGLSISCTSRQVTVSIRDSGAGIPPEEQHVIFERFYRSRSNGSEGPRGMGLGLAIVKSIISAHGGRVGVRSKLGAGSTFWFTLPVMGSRSNRRDRKESRSESTNG